LKVQLFYKITLMMEKSFNLNHKSYTCNINILFEESLGRIERQIINPSRLKRVKGTNIICIFSLHNISLDLFVISNLLGLFQ
jgi:hypothetical protein